MALSLPAGLFRIASFSRDAHYFCIAPNLSENGFLKIFKGEKRAHEKMEAIIVGLGVNYAASLAITFTNKV